MNCAYLRQWTAALILVGTHISVASCFDYCTTPCVMRQTYKHTMCLYPKEVASHLCRNLDWGKMLTVEDKDYLVKIHNQLRSKVAEGKESRGSPGPQPPASNMMELVWDNELELIAKRWALQCDYKHDQCRATKDRTYAGQNLAISYNSIGFQNNLETQVMSWYDEVDFTPRYTVDTFLTPSTTSGDIGHYTQLVWAGTSRMGCARVFFYFSDWGMTEFLVCNYAQGGNVKNHPMYKKGKHCSACADGIKCSTKYPGLCANPGDKEVKDTATTAPPGVDHVYNHATTAPSSVEHVNDKATVAPPGVENLNDNVTTTPYSVEPVNDKVTTAPSGVEHVYNKATTTPTSVKHVNDKTMIPKPGVNHVNNKVTTEPPGAEHNNDKTAIMTGGAGSSADLVQWKLIPTLIPAIVFTVMEYLQ